MTHLITKFCKTHHQNEESQNDETILNVQLINASELNTDTQ